MVLTFYVSEEGVLKGVCLKIGELYILIKLTSFYNIIFELVYLSWSSQDPLKPSFWDNFEMHLWITFVDVDFCSYRINSTNKDCYMYVCGRVVAI